MAGGKKLVGQTVRAPVVSRQVIKNPMYMKVQAIRTMSNKNSLLWHVRFRAAQCVFSAGNVYSCNVQLATSTGGQVYLWPTNSIYTPPSVYPMVRLFERYCLSSLQMHYVARVTTAANSTVFCSYFSDPEYFQSLGVVSSVTALTEGSLHDSMGCKSWPAWKSMTCPPQRSRKFCYTVGGDQAAVYDYAVVAATARQFAAGVYGIVMTGNPTPGAAITAGDVYFELNIILDKFRAAGTSTVGEERKNPFEKEESVPSRVESLEQKFHDLTFKLEGNEELIEEMKEKFIEKKTPAKKSSEKGTLPKKDGL